MPLLRLQQSRPPWCVDEARFLRAYETEIAATAARAPGRPVSSIFFGGGTPSLMQPSIVADDPRCISKYWTFAPNVEVTLEANPTSVEATRFRGFRAAGVNRVSLGVQSLDDASLKELGRLHTAQEALNAVAIARSIFERYSFDLIYARPRHTLDAWAADSNARSQKRPNISRSINSPSNQTRRSPVCTRPENSPSPTRTSRATFTISRKRFAPMPAYRPTRFPITRGPARSAGTISFIGVGRLCRRRPGRAWPA